MKMALGIVFVLMFVSSLALFAYAIYFFYRAITNLRPDKTISANLFAPVAIFIPALFTDIGKQYRRRFFASFFAGVAVLAVVMVIRLAMKPG